MKRLALLLAALLSTGTVHATCEPGGIGGTGISADGGIGGTGIQAEADLGLIGVITAFGSICVNGIEVHYNADTPVSSNGAAASPASLALGQLVAVRAAANSGQARALDIQIVDALVGRVAAFDPAANRLEIAGQRVQLSPSTVLAVGTAPGSLAGENVRVSGLWRADGSVAATRIERAPADAGPRIGTRQWPDLGTHRLIVEGYVADVRPDVVRVGGMLFKADPRVSSGLEPDRLVRLSARTERDGSRIAERIDLLDRPRGGGEGPRPSLEQRGRSEGSGGGTDRVERLERSEQRGPGRPDRPERIERPDRIERIERPDRSGRN